MRFRPTRELTCVWDEATGRNRVIAVKDLPIKPHIRLKAKRYASEEEALLAAIRLAVAEAQAFCPAAIAELQNIREEIRLLKIAA